MKTTGIKKQDEDNAQNFDFLPGMEVRSFFVMSKTGDNVFQIMPLHGKRCIAKSPLSLRSRRRHKAWGVSPRSKQESPRSSRMRATACWLQKGEQFVQLGCRPFHGLSIPFDIDPGAYAPGFMPAPAPQAFCRGGDSSELRRVPLIAENRCAPGSTTSSPQRVYPSRCKVRRVLVENPAGARDRQHFDTVLPLRRTYPAHPTTPRDVRRPSSDLSKRARRV